MLFDGMLQHDLRGLLPLIQTVGFSDVEIAPAEFRVLGFSNLAFARGSARKIFRDVGTLERRTLEQGRTNIHVHEAKCSLWVSGLPGRPPDVSGCLHDAASGRATDTVAGSGASRAADSPRRHTRRAAAGLGRARPPVRARRHWRATGKAASRWPVRTSGW